MPWHPSPGRRLAQVITPVDVAQRQPHPPAFAPLPAVDPIPAAGPWAAA